jgi:hypothetical protein
MSVRQAQAEIDAQEFTEWMEFYHQEPWGEWRSDLRAGIVAATVANSAGGKSTFQAKDFMPDFTDNKPAAKVNDPRAIEAFFLRKARAVVEAQRRG